MATDKETRILDLIPESLHDQLKSEVLKEIELDKKKAAATPLTEEELDAIVSKM